MLISLPPLPFSSKALEPHISERTLLFHHGKHHGGYVGRLRDQIRGTRLAHRALAEIVRVAWKAGNLPLFNNAAQAWNHEFFWHSLSPQYRPPSDSIASLIARDFGDVQRLIDAMIDAAMLHFGSGWVWLVLEAGSLKVVTTSNADSPLLYHRQTPLLTIDVWEHAYYLDYQNDRKRYLENVSAHLLNWDVANDRLRASTWEPINDETEKRTIDAARG